MKTNCYTIPAVLSVVVGAVLSPAAAQSLKVDFNGNSFGATIEQTQPGYHAYNAQNEVAGSFGPRSYSAFGTTITVTPTWTGSPTHIEVPQAWWRDNAYGYSTNSAEMLDLLIDWIGTDQRHEPGDPMTLTVSGLPAGNYGWLSYHHDTQNQQGRFSVTVNDAAGSTTTSGLRVSSTQSLGVTNLAGVTKFATPLISDGVNPVTLVWEATDAPNFNTMFVMNGFEITNAVVVAPQQTNAALRRPISPNQPMWLVHIDTWNYADPQKIIDLIPPDIRPYVVFNISLSVSHVQETSQFQVAEYGYEIAKSWLRVCAQNRVWAMIQPSSGAYSQFSDFDLSVYEEFFREYPNLIGFNYCEQFWGYGDSDPLATTWTDRINHFANLLPLSRKYGGYLVVSWCGNQWSPNINPIAMLKRNANFAAACAAAPQNYILCEKYTQQSYQSDMESLCLGAYLSGYSGQYGIRYDSTGWTDHTGTNQNFLLASGGAPHLEHIMLTGQTIVDGPELIWQQCFRELSSGSTSNGYTMRRWETFPQFDNVSVDLFRKILDGTVRIPTRQEVIDRTKVVIINNVNSGSDDDRYSSPETLFEGLYRMDGDGNLRNNKTFFKKTGRYPTVPTVYQLNDAAAQSFAVKVNKSGYSSRWPSIAAKTNEFNSLFPQEYTGDIYAGRHENGWVIYNPYKTGQAASGSIPFKYNTAERVDLTLDQYTAGVMKETSNSVTFYLANYLNSGMRTNTITIHGSTTEPTWSFVNRATHSSASTVSKSWSGGVFTLTIQQNGPLDITVNCAGTATGRLTSYTPAVLTPPAIPLTYTGPLQYEAEIFEYKSIAGIVKSGWDQPVRNYSGQGYAQFGTSASAALRKTVTVLKAGTYRIEIKYSNPGATRNNIHLYANGVYAATPVFATTPTYSDWTVTTQYVTLNAGANTLEFLAQGTGANVYFDNIVVAPAVDIVDGFVIQENAPGFTSVDGTIDNLHAGYTGAGYANTADTNGASIYWNLNFGSAVTKSLTFRYASTNAGTANLIVNGVNVASDLQFPSTGAWTNWDYVTVYPYIASGAAQVRLQATSADGLPNIDYVEVVGGGTTMTLPPAPTGLVATTGGADQVNLTWIASSNATTYNLKRGTVSGGPYTTIATEITNPNYGDAGVAPGATYYYLVTAVNYIGESAPSAEASITLPASVIMVGYSTGQYTVTSGSGVTAGTFDLNDNANVLVVGVYIDANNIACLTNLTSFGGVPPTGLIQTSAAGNRQFALYWLNPNTAAGQSLVIGATASANIGAGYFALQLAGVDTNAPVVRTGATTTDANNVNITTTAANSFIVSFYSANDSGLTLTPTAPLTSLGATLNTINGIGGGGSLAAGTTTRETAGTQNLAWSSSGTTAQHGVNGFAFAPLAIAANTPPTLAAISDRTIGAGVTLTITNSASDPDVPAQTLTYSLLNAPTNAAVNVSSGVFTWRPFVSQANSINPFSVVVTDDGTPSLSATQSFLVAVTNLVAPQIATVTGGGGALVLQVNGASGPDYQIQASTNLTDWSAIFTTNSPPVPFIWTNNATGLPMNFFRVRIGPPL
jgi:hypothetical protein